MIGNQTSSFKYLPLIIIICCALIFGGCNKKEAQDWEKAVELNTIQGYQEYLEQWPESKNSNEARDEVAWLQTKKINTEEAYWEYMQNYKYNKYYDEANQRRNEHRDWDILIRTDSTSIITKLKRHLGDYPDGIFADEVKEIIAHYENLIDIAYSMKPVIHGIGVEGASDYNPNQPRDNKVVLVDALFNNMELNFELPDSLSPSSINEVTLVVVILDQRHVVLESAEYTTIGTVSRKQEEMQLELREAKTGALIKSETIKSMVPLSFPDVLISGFDHQLVTSLDLPDDIVKWVYNITNQ